MTYEEALHYLNSLINYERLDTYDYKKSFRLDRTRRLAAFLGDPHKGIRPIHIAGTKGKGSTCAIVHSILKNAGFSVGLYTSPHLVSFRERIRINDSLISEEDVARLLERIRGAVEKMGDDEPSFFEVYTVLAYLYFKEKGVDFAVYETGLGGRLDATNIVNPLVCAITPISYEHTDKLGSTLGEIAAEKAGIIKDGSICVSAPQDPEALAVIEKIAKDKNAKLILVGRDIVFEESKRIGAKEQFSVYGVFGEYPMLEMSLVGSHQVVNAVTAIGIIESLSFCGIAIPVEAIRKGVECAKWEGRLEVVCFNPLIVLDGAQNRASANALVRAVKKHFKYKDLILIFGVSKDKDIGGILEELLPISDRVVLTRSKVVRRAQDPSKIREHIKDEKNEIIITESVEEALDVARSIGKGEDLVLVTGSLFVVGEARNILISDKTYA